MFMVYKMSADLERKQRDSDMKNAINSKLDENFERERLMELLRTRLKECGWREKLAQECKDIIKEKGLDKVTVDDLVNEVTPKARETVPDEVKRELLERIRSYFGDNV
ncbi:transcription and mRNA export factor ENY2-2-like [Xenia sp. Carnegie-2017]|uniref:transcription and mRNA export factor ENY2-2-like n=1 Tax=Xenia sp. Carnegie-2017 TaxID=2897299 RepID=UPI001F033767|nr:transcription and mRNA export factor ENY2-2-like [Xenia sp. Carnegie-2017]XP_046853127.1 transcription and mRNA export factor ENY2-2-like [Xenia sp. Carnegie-2017]XP_046853128.1 transcription and mRNA export factor ENY2-2-like [Xenia sp. Carnegie-2017]